MPSKLPLRPKNKRYDLTEAELRALRNVVAFGEDKKDMYAAFVRPDLVTSPALLKKYSDQFFAQTDARNFMSDYAKLLDGAREEAETSAEPKTREERKAQAVDKFTDKVVDKMSGVLDSVEEMDAIAKLADRVGVLSEKEERVEVPRRYLPTRCNTDCKYRFWAEQVVKTGDAIDCCEYCRALEYAKERGFIYDPTKLLSVVIPEYTKVKNTKSESDGND